MARKPQQKQSKAQMLLLEYRPAIWRKSAFESIPGAGNKVLQACTEQMSLTQELVEMLRNNKLLGEKLYWIIYASYMTEQEPGDVDEILSEISQKHGDISRRTYFRLKGRAIRMMDGYLNEMTA